MPSRRYWPKGLPLHLSVPQTSLYYNLEVSAARFPDKDAVIFYGNKISYRALRADVDRLAGFLQRRCGVKRGDRVFLCMPNSPQFIIAYYAILRADAMVATVSPLNQAAELAGYLADCGAAVAIVGQELFERIIPNLGNGLQHLVVAAYSDCLRTESGYNVPDFVKAPREPLAVPGVTLWNDALEADLAPGAHLAGPEDLCVLPYTSGTTGKPMGCVHRHRSVMTTAVAHNAWLGTVPDTVAFAVLPFFHVTGMQAGMNAPIHYGNTIVLMARWDPQVALQMVERHEITDWTNIASMVTHLLQTPTDRPYRLSSLARIGGGGATMPESVAVELRKLCGLTYLEGYGLTETIAHTLMNPPAQPKAQCLGIPIFDTDVRIVNTDTLQVLDRPGEEGEIVCRGPQVFEGYWQKLDATAEAFIEIEGKRFFRTGDIARFDDEGYFFLVDRRKRMINSGAHKVWPAKVETVMSANPDISEVCVIGMRDADRGEAVKALVVLKNNRRGQVTGADIIAWCKENMHPYDCPRAVEFRDSLPRSATGKVQWRLLQEEADAASG